MDWVPIANLVAAFTKIDSRSDEERGLCRVKDLRVSISIDSNKIDPSTRGPQYVPNTDIASSHMRFVLSDTCLAPERHQTGLTAYTSTCGCRYFCSRTRSSSS